MTARLNPYLHFRDSARAAMTFYQEVFGGELSMNTFAEFAEQGAPAGPDADLLMHAMLETPSGFTLMGSDTPSYMEFTPGTTVTVSLSGDQAEELRGYWQKLSADGEVTFALAVQMWGDEFGMCVDKFGIEWMVNIAVPQG